MPKVSNTWGSDSPVSVPTPVDPDLPKIAFGGFCFTPQGIRVDADHTDIENDYLPPFSPDDGDD